MTRHRTALVATLLSLTASLAQAGTYSGMITKIDQYVDGRTFVGVQGTLTRAACATHPDFQIVFDASQPGGKGILTQLLAAKLAEKPVFLGGTGGCTRQTGYEDLYHLNVD